MKKEKTKIGIWGFGIVGKSAANYFYSSGNKVEIFDNRKLPDEEKKLLLKQNVPVTQNLQHFLQNNDFILPSPGIDLRPYKKYQHKWITELDIIQKNFPGPIVAITGTAGKTTVTHLLSELLKENGVRVWTGGNIGTGMLDLLTTKKDFDLALLELSSFQLEHTKTFAPDLAIWTNFSENHLDRHGTMEDYFLAKKKIIERQKKEQHAILPLSIAKKVTSFKELKSTLHFFSTDQQDKSEVEHIFYRNNSLMRHGSGKKVVCPNETNIFQHLPQVTFQENLLILSVATTLLSEMLGKKLHGRIKKVTTPPHRLEKVATLNNTIFYNDSKSTTPASTLAAVKQLSGKPIILFLGGLSKGIDRKNLIFKIKPWVKIVYTFGAEAENISGLCAQAGVDYFSFKNLHDAFAECIKKINPGDQILFSPAGSSFDLFKNYEERGNYFKKLVKQLTSTSRK